MKTLFSASFPRWSEFEQFDKDIRKIGFIKINKYKNPGKETGYYFPFDILDDKGRILKRRKVVIWTTAMEYEKVFKHLGEDAGRVLIIDVTLDKNVQVEEEIVYSARYFARVGNFFDRLYRYAEIQKERIIRAPLCPHDDCKIPMDIRMKTGTRQYHWVCKSNTKHVEPVFEQFDVNLDKKSTSYLQIRRKKVASRKKSKKEK